MSRAVGVTSEVGLTADSDLSVLTVLKKYDVFYSSDIPVVTWYEPLYIIYIYIYRYIYIHGLRLDMVVTIPFNEFEADQKQYNLESAQ